MKSTSMVAAVIPTRNRPALVARAVHSALSQTVKDLEVIVVVDGPDPVTAAALGKIADQRVRVIALTSSVGGSDARNIGVANAHTEWIAFLDDDDEWFPTKIEKQLAVALSMADEFPVISCRLRVKNPRFEAIWPRRVIGDEPVSEYLFCQHGLFAGEGQFQTSAILTRKALLSKVPFTPGIRRHQDTEWYLRVAELPGVKFHVVPEVLSIYYCDNRAAITGMNNWESSLQWLRAQRQRMTPKAYAGFIAGQLSREAAREGKWSSIMPLLTEMVTKGAPRFIDFPLFASRWLVPSRSRAFFRRCAGR